MLGTFDIINAFVHADDTIYLSAFNEEGRDREREREMSKKELGIALRSPC